MYLHFDAVCRFCHAALAVCVPIPADLDPVADEVVYDVDCLNCGSGMRALIPESREVVESFCKGAAVGTLIMNQGS